MNRKMAYVPYRAQTGALMNRNVLIVLPSRLSILRVLIEFAIVLNTKQDLMMMMMMVGGGDGEVARARGRAFQRGVGLVVLK